jgi:hypothetical protein
MIIDPVTFVDNVVTYIEMTMEANDDNITLKDIQISDEMKKGFLEFAGKLYAKMYVEEISLFKKLWREAVNEWRNKYWLDNHNYGGIL